MAIGLASDFKIYHEEFFGGYVEILEQNANAFNGASQNAIQLIPDRMRGDYEKESFIQSIATLATRRDTTSVAAATDTALTQGELVGVKLNRRIGPVANTFDSFKKIEQNPQAMSFMLGQQIGKAVAVEMINTALASLNAALAGQAALTHDASAAVDPDGPGLTHTNMVTAMAQFGDASAQIVAWVMHSKNYFDLVKTAIADKIFEVAGVTIYSGNVATFGRPVVVIDSASLIDTVPVPDEYAVLGLATGAATLNESEGRDIVSDVVTGLDNLVIRLQGEYAYNLKLRGMAWDITNGGANPADAALATSTNWDKAATDDKSLPGVRLVVQ